MEGKKGALTAAGYAGVLIGIAGCVVSGGMLGSAQKTSDAGGVPVALILLGCSLYALGTVYLLSPVEERRRFGCANIGAVLALVFLGAAVYPVLLSARIASQRANCHSVSKSLGMALHLYASDNDEHFPPADRWRSVLPSTSESEGRCSFGETPWTNALNLALSSLSTSDLYAPAKTVMVFEANAWEKDAAGGKEWFARPHNGFGTVAFADGHVMRINLKGSQSDMIWNSGPADTGHGRE